MFNPQVAVFGLILFIVFVVLFALWIGPLLRHSPDAKTNYMRVHRGHMMGKSSKLSAGQTIKYKLVGLKQKLLTALVTISVVTIYVYDNFSPVFGNIDYQPIVAKLGPNWLLLGNLVIPLILLWFRKLAERRPQ